MMALEDGDVSLAHAGAASAVLGSIRLRSTVFIDGRFSEPFGIICPASWDEAQPLAPFRHMSLFHFISSGACRVEVAPGRFEDCRAGDIVFMPFPAPHRIMAGEPEEFVVGDTMAVPGPLPGSGIVTYGGGLGDVRIICGYIQSLEMRPEPLFRQLPSHIKYDTSKTEVSADLARLARRLADDVFIRGVRAAPVALNRIMETMFIGALDELMDAAGARMGLLAAAMKDPVAGRILEIIYTSAPASLSVAGVVARLGCSASTASARFKKATGVSIGKYIAEAKLQKGAEQLIETDISISEVAAAVGYDNEFAFSRAFSRVFGVSPGRWRTANAARM